MPGHFELVNSQCRRGDSADLSWHWPATKIPEWNNESEYEAILARIELKAAISADKLIIRSDSQLVVGQVNAEYESRDPRMVKYITLVK